MAGIFGSNTIFSAVKGKVILNGNAVSGASVEQYSAHGSNEAIRRTTETSEEGIFSFDEIRKRRWLGGLSPFQFTASEEITITYEGVEYVGWVYTKTDPEPLSESGGKPFTLVCDLGIEADYVDQYYGICRLVNDEN